MLSRLYLFIIFTYLAHFHTPHPSGKPLIFSPHLWDYFCFATFVHLFYSSHSTHKWNHTWTAARQTSLSITNSWSLLKFMSIELVMISNHLILCHLLLLLLQSFLESGSFQMSQFFTSGGQSIGVSASASVFLMNIQDWLISFRWTDWFPLDGLIGSPCSTRYSQECSRTAQFKNINSFPLRFLYSPILTSMHDYW